jgi:tRNA A-37 threonylcarbamoyl transferase component Bud32
MFENIIQLLLRRDKVALYLDDILNSPGFIIHKSKESQCSNIKGHTIFETKSSIILELEDGNILKCLKIRNWTEYHKLLLGKSRAKDEVSSNYKMHKIGLAVPEIVYDGIFSNVLSKRDFSSFYCMKAIPSTFTPGNEIFKSLSKNARGVFIQGMILDIKKLKDNNLVYSDLSLKNFLLNDSGKHYWIDTQVKKYFRPNLFEYKFNHSLNRLINDYAIEFSAKEKNILHSLIIL